MVGPPTGKRRGRKAGARVPCDECIVRASKKRDNGASLELCARCTGVLSRPKGIPEQTQMKKVRKQTTANSTLSVHREKRALPWSEDHMVQHALHFFTKHSAAQLSGYLDSPFWQRMVVEAGGREPTVIHAIAAIGSLHEIILTGAFHPGDSQDQSTDFALQQCNRSIQYLMAPSSDGRSPDLRLMLTTCILYTYFEALQGHDERAINHAKQGYSLVDQYAMDNKNEDGDVTIFSVELDQLDFMMRRLHSNAGDLMTQPSIIGPNTVSSESKRPAQFANLHEARSGLELVLTQLSVFFMDMELDDKTYELAASDHQRRLQFTSWLKTWEMAFSHYLTQVKASMSPEDRKGAMILKTHHLVAEILSEVDLSLGEPGWNAFHDKFAAIVDLAAAVLVSNGGTIVSHTTHQWQQDDKSLSSALSLNLGIFDALYEVCARCTDKDLQRRALDLIKRRTRHEHMWGSWSAWKVDKFLLKMEHAGSGSPTTRTFDITSQPRANEQNTQDVYGALGKAKELMAHHTPLHRGHPRRSLNPGLYQRQSMDMTSSASPIQKAYTYPAAAYSTPPAESSYAGSLGPAFESFETSWYEYPSMGGAMSQHATFPRTPPID